MLRLRGKEPGVVLLNEGRILALDVFEHRELPVDRPEMERHEAEQNRHRAEPERSRRKKAPEMKAPRRKDGEEPDRDDRKERPAGVEQDLDQILADDHALGGLASLRADVEGDLAQRDLAEDAPDELRREVGAR